jgi:hypothetical protein
MVLFNLFMESPSFGAGMAEPPRGQSLHANQTRLEACGGQGVNMN